MRNSRCRSRSFFVLFLAICLLAPLLPARNLAAQPLPVEDAAIQGVLTFDKRYVTVRPLIFGQPLRVVMRFDPQDEQELGRRSGFFVLDGDRLRSFFAGGSLLDNNLAAGSPAPNGPINELVAVISQPSGEYTVIIYNDTDIPMTFRLSAENGIFPLEERRAEEALAQPETGPDPSVAATTPPETSAETFHIVQAGQTLSLIAQATYGDLTLYDRLCSYNSIPNCDVLQIGQRIRIPELAVLTGSAAPATRPISGQPAAQPVAVTPAGTTAGTYTVASGDTLGTIAQKLLGDFQRFREICTLNGLTDCNILQIGQVLRLPDGSGVAQNPVTSTAVASQPAAVASVSSTQASGGDIASTLESAADKSVFLFLWNTTGLTSILKDAGPLTLFAPSNGAFAPGLQANLKKWTEDKQTLEQLLSYHVLVQAFDPDSVAGAPVNLPTLSGSTLRVERTASGGLLVNGANVIGTPITASNGTIYTIDQVLSPPTE